MGVLDDLESDYQQSSLDSLEADYQSNYSGYSDLPYSIAKKSYGGITKALGGVTSFLEDYAPYIQAATGQLPTGIQDEYKVGGDIVDYAQGVLNDANSKYRFEPGSASDYADRIGTTVTQTLPVMLSGGAALPLMAAQSFGSNYSDAKAEGQSPGMAAIRGGANAAIDTAFGKFNLNRLVNPGSSLTRRVVESELANVLTSPFQTIGNTVVNSRTGQEAPSPEEFKQRLKENFITDAGTGIVSPLVAHPIVRGQVKRAEAESQARIDAVAEKMLMSQEAEAALNQAVDAKVNLPGENLDVSQRLQDAAQMAPDTGNRIIPINPEEPSGIIPVESSPRTPDFQQELQSAAKPSTQFITDEQGRPLNAPPAEPQPIVKPFTTEGTVRQNLQDSEKQVVKELALVEKRKNELESKKLPVPIQPKTETPNKAIDMTSFPKVMEYVRKNVPTERSNEVFLNALNKQRESIETGKPLLLDAPKVEAQQKIEELKAADPDYNVPPATRSMLAEHGVVELPNHLIQLSKDVPNFKSGANERGVVDGEELKGEKYDRLGTAPIVVWERADGRLEVISGRHRLDFNKRVGEKTIPSQVVREADGFTANMARILDAELNIRDGNGTIKDYATYFKESGLSEGEATARGLLSRSKGIQGFAIGTKSSPELSTLYNSGRISDAKAAAIANGAPNNSDLQRVGIKEAKNLDADALSSMLRRLSQDPTLNNSDPAQQTDLFGANDSALNKVRDEARVVGDLKKEIQRMITAAYDAAKDPKTAREMGVDPKDPEGTLKRIEELKTAKEKWEEFWKFPELQAELQKRVAQMKEVGKKVTKKIIKSLKNEKGAVSPDLLGITAAARALGITNKDIAKTTHETLDQKETQDIIKRYGRLGETGTDNRFVASEAEKLTGSYIQKAIVFPETVGKKSQWFRDGMLTPARRGLEVRDTTAFDLAETAAPYFRLGDTSRVDEALAAARKNGTAYIPTESNLKSLGLTDPEVEAFMSVRKAMDKALDIYKDTLIKKGMEPADAEIQTMMMKKANYIPFSRFGELFVRAYTPDGKTAGFWMFESPKEMAAKVAELNAGGIRTDSGEFKENPDSPGSDGVHPGGFGAHLLESFEVAGYNKNLKRNIASYITSLAQHTGRTEMQVGFKDAFDKAPANSPELIKYAKNYSDYMLSNEGESAAFRQAMTAMYLGLNLKSAMVNLTQSVTTTLPKSIQYLGVKNGAKAQASALSLLSQRITNPEGFAKLNPELDAAINSAIKQGTITEQGFREMAGRARTASGETGMFGGLVDKTMVFFDLAEKANRYTAFVTGYNIAKAKGLSGDSALTFAKQFTTDTQFDYSKVNRPIIARGKIGAPLLTFKLFTGNYIRFLRDLNATGLVAAVGAMGAIGGLSAFPFMKELIKGSELAGFDPKGAIKNAFGDGSVTELLTYGIPYAAGLADLSGSAGVGEIVPFPDELNNKGFFQAAGKTIGGVPGDMISRGFNAYERYDQGDTGEAVQALLPESLKNLSMSINAYKKGAFTNFRGQRVLENPSIFELAAKAIGVTPKRLRENYDTMHRISVLDKTATDNDNINHKLARAIVEGGDVAGIKRAHLAKNKGLKPWEKSFPDKKAIDKMVKELRDPIGGAIKNLPKDARLEGRRIAGR